MILGCIADDLTGATDLGLMLARGGMRVVQVIGVPEAEAAPPNADAVVVALKSRTSPAADAVAQSLRSLEALQRWGARQFFFKYCSTFDSTDSGNIGPVAEALLERLEAPLALATPAFPATGRTVYRGHLFVGDELLSDSPMKDHPLTPMRDSNLVRVLQRQTRLPVGLVPFATVERGAEAIAAAFEQVRAEGVRLAIVDVLTDGHLLEIGKAAAGMALITGGSGIGLGLPDNYRRLGLLPARSATAAFAAPPGRAAILAGSCSAATRAQIREAASLPSLRLDPDALMDRSQTAESALAWARTQPPDKPIVIYSTAEPDEVRAAQRRHGQEAAAAAVEGTLAAVARGLAADGVSRFIVAGGETSGAVVAALGVKALEFGPEIDPGVPWTRSVGGPDLALALKSGNFGTPDFFLKAWRMLS